MKFKVGDKVCYKHKKDYDNVEVGEIGTICGISEELGNYGVAFETKDVFKHSCGGLCRDSYGWWCDEDTLEPADNIVRMADGTIIGEFNTGGVCTGFRSGKISNDLIVSYREMERMMDLLSKFDIKELKPTKEENNLKFTFYTTEGYRMDKSNNTKIPTMTTEVLYKDKDGCAKGGSATCDKADYDERQGCLEALANMCCGGNFDREYNKAVRYNKKQDIKNRTCLYCGQVFDTFKERLEHEAWHVERKKARRERYLLRKRAKEIAFEEAAQKMAKEMMGEQK